VGTAGHVGGERLAGWLVIAGIILVATIAIHPSTRLARRFLERHVPADILADARASSSHTDKGTSTPSLRHTDESLESAASR
jgi:hypothetical protein